MKIFLIVLNVVSVLIAVCAFIISFFSGITNDKSISSYASSSLGYAVAFLLVSVIFTVLYFRVEFFKTHIVLVGLIALLIIILQLVLTILPYQLHSKETDNKQDASKKQLNAEISAFSATFDKLVQEKRTLSQDGVETLVSTTVNYEKQSGRLNGKMGIPEPLKTTWKNILHNALINPKETYFILDGSSFDGHVQKKDPYTLAQIVVVFHIELFEDFTEGYESYLNKENIDKNYLVLKLVTTPNPTFAEDYKTALAFMLIKGADKKLKNENGETAEDILNEDIDMHNKSSSAEYNATDSGYILEQELLKILREKGEMAI